MTEKLDSLRILEKHLKGLTSNTAIIKHVVYYLGPIRVEEIARITSEFLRSFKADEEGIRSNILPILEKKEYYKQVNGMWDVEIAKFPEHRVIPEIFQREHRLLSEREVKNKIAAELSIKVKEVCFEIERDENLKKFDGGWGLKKWELVNDQAVQVLKAQGMPLAEREIIQLISEKYKKPVEGIVLSLNTDKRFVQEKKVWALKEEVEARKIKGGRRKIAERRDDVQLELEKSFLKAQGIVRKEQPDESPPRKMKVKLRKTASQQVREMLKERELQVIPVEVDLAAELSSSQVATSVAETTTFSRVEHSPKERSLSAREREAIASFVEQLARLEDKGVGESTSKLRREPLSLNKILNLLRLKYVPYFAERVVIPEDYYRFAAELITPRAGQTVLNPSCHDGLFAIEVLTAVFARLEGSAWAPHGSQIEVVQKDGLRYRIGVEGTSLQKKSLEDFLVTQTDVLDYFIENNFAAIEYDRILAQSAKYCLRLAGFPNVYLANMDYLSQLPEVFGEPANDRNEISLRFDLVFGNLTFLKSHNLSANYLDQSLRILERDGVGAFFVHHDLLKLLKDNPFMEGVLTSHYFHYIFTFPPLEGVSEVKLIVLKRKSDEKPGVSLVTARIKDVKDLRYILVDLARGIKQSPYYECLSQESVPRILFE